MSELLPIDHALAPAAALVVGVLLLIAGRRLFWLALGVAGFVLALVFAIRYLDVGPLWVQVALALVAGAAGALLAVFLQRAAVALAGFLVGGYGALVLWLELGQGQGPGAWLVFLVAGVVAAILAGALFEAALVAVSALVGAVLIVDAAGVQGAAALALVIVLALAGGLVQSAFGRRDRD